VQAEALLEAGATVYALDRLEEPSEDFHRVQQRAAEELGMSELTCSWKVGVPRS
jgi:NAD(P)-dependent dehydrogenase (short-subunit alcohol dehydrogenase family)